MCLGFMGYYISFIYLCVYLFVLQVLDVGKVCGSVGCVVVVFVFFSCVNELFCFCF